MGHKEGGYIRGKNKKETEKDKKRALQQKTGTETKSQ